MSRIGLKPIKIEDGVTVLVNGADITVTGTKGEIKVTLPKDVSVEVKENVMYLTSTEETKQSHSNHGTFRMLVANAIEGVKNGFEKKLELVGVGYRARMEGLTLVMSLGWNHPVKVEPIAGIDIEVPEETKVTIKGFDKQLVGEFAAKVRAIRKPEPYKGKGIRSVSYTHLTLPTN
jgi:large subunit ribosomal protein L6